MMPRALRYVLFELFSEPSISLAELRQFSLGILVIYHVTLRVVQCFTRDHCQQLSLINEGTPILVNSVELAPADMEIFFINTFNTVLTSW